MEPTGAAAAAGIPAEATEAVRVHQPRSVGNIVSFRLSPAPVAMAKRGGPLDLNRLAQSSQLGCLPAGSRRRRGLA